MPIICPLVWLLSTCRQSYEYVVYNHLFFFFMMMFRQHKTQRGKSQSQCIFWSLNFQIAYSKISLIHSRFMRSKSWALKMTYRVTLPYFRTWGHTPWIAKMPRQSPTMAVSPWCLGAKEWSTTEKKMNKTVLTYERNVFVGTLNEEQICWGPCGA